MNQVVTLSSVEVKKTGVSKKGPWALRLFTAAGGAKFQTFDVGLGEELEGRLNLPLELAYEIEDNGNFQNNVIKGWKPASEQAVQAQASEPSQPTSNDRDAKQRSKEEVRYTAAIQAAAVVLSSEKDFSLHELKSVADAINDLITAA